MITKNQIKQLISSAHLPVLDARVAWWRSSQYGFVIRQETDTPQRYITIESRYPASESAEPIATALQVLRAANISAGASMGIIYVHPLQLDEVTQ